MLSDNKVHKFLSVNAHFFNLPIALNRKLFNMYEKKASSEKEKTLVV